jgi:HEAT repeat protein
MSDATSKQLLALTDPKTSADLRRAAVQVIGEIGTRDTPTSEALCQAITDNDPEVRLRALEAIGKLKIDRALNQLVERVEAGGPEGEAAALAAARIGARGSRALQDLMGHVAPGLRRKIAGALGASGTAAAETAALDALLDKDPGVVEAAVASLVGEVPSLTASHRQAFAEHLLQLLKQARKQPLSLVSEAAVLRLLSALNEPRAEPYFWERIDPAWPAEVRAAALQGLGKKTATPSGEKLTRLMRCATDPDFRVAAAAMMMLRAVPVSDRTVDDWLPLLQGGDVAVRRLALEKMGGRDSAQVAEALSAQAEHPDRAFRDEVVARLGKLKHGPAALVKILLEADTPDRTWSLGRIQQTFVKSYPRDLRSKLLKAGCKYLEEGDRRADAVLNLVRQADAVELRDHLESRALELRKKKKYDAALAYLRLLNRDPATGLPLRFEFAGCALKCSAKDLAGEARAADSALSQFGNLLHHHGHELLPLLQKAKWLDAEDLFYLGFHFAEKERQDKEFGGKVLELAIARSPRSQVAKDARNKLKRAGLK